MRYPPKSKRMTPKTAPIAMSASAPLLSPGGDGDAFGLDVDKPELIMSVVVLEVWLQLKASRRRCYYRYCLC